MILGLGIGVAAGGSGDDDDSSEARPPATRNDDGDDDSGDEEQGFPLRSTVPTTRASEADGTRDNPFPLGTPLSTDDGWEVTINSVNFDAAGDIAAQNQFNDPAPPGLRYALINATVTNGSAEQGYPSVYIRFTMVGSQNRSYDGSNSYCLAVIPEPLDDSGELFPGGSFTGNTCLQVPEAEVMDGSLLVAVSPSFGDPVFVRTA